MKTKNKEKKLIVCFDLDDTLIDDNYKFELTFCDCIKTILLSFETRAPQIDEVLSLARAIDNNKIEQLPANKRYKPERLLQTWLDTYEELCRKNKIRTKKHIKLLLIGLVRGNFDPPYFVIPGVIEILISLKKANYQTHIVSTGTKQIQRKKLIFTGLHKYFDETHILLDGDKKKCLESLSEKHGKNNIIMVGNSLRSDINPALETDIKAIYIPRGSWHQFNAEPYNNKFIKLNSINELLPAINQIAESTK